MPKTKPLKKTIIDAQVARDYINALHHEHRADLRGDTHRRMKIDDLTHCPYCNSREVVALTFDSDIEGITPVAYLPYFCESCNKSWTIELRAVIIHLKSK